MRLRRPPRRVYVRSTVRAGYTRATLAGLLAVAATLFVFAPAALAQVSFTGPTNFPTNDGPLEVAVGDFNGDGDPDLAVATQGSDSVSVLLGGAGGSFSAPTDFAVGFCPSRSRWATSTATATRISPWPTSARTASRCSSAGRAVASAARPTSPLRTLPPRSRWATSTATATRTSPWPTSARTASRSCSAGRAVASAARPTSPPATGPSRWPSATSTATATPTSPQQTSIRTTSRCSSAGPAGASPPRPTSPPGPRRIGGSRRLQRRRRPRPCRFQRRLGQRVGSARRPGRELLGTEQLRRLARPSARSLSATSTAMATPTSPSPVKSSTASRWCSAGRAPASPPRRVSPPTTHRSRSRWATSTGMGAWTSR